ncbi:hypothetical protein T06_7452 [Trichinella sp. T6]|nr:hypothetical protein T06_7452 [Trichinella sp. T6]
MCKEKMEKNETSKQCILQPTNKLQCKQHSNFSKILQNYLNNIHN